MMADTMRAIIAATLLMLTLHYASYVTYIICYIPLLRHDYADAEMSAISCLRYGIRC